MKTCLSFNETFAEIPVVATPPGLRIFTVTGIERDGDENLTSGAAIDESLTLHSPVDSSAALNRINVMRAPMTHEEVKIFLIRKNWIVIMQIVN